MFYIYFNMWTRCGRRAVCLALERSLSICRGHRSPGDKLLRVAEDPAQARPLVGSPNRQGFSASR